MLISGATFASFTLAHNFWELWLTQFGLAASWAFIFVGSLRHLDECNVEKATSTGLFWSVQGLSAIIGPVCATVLIQVTDYHGIMYVAALFAVVATGLFVYLDRRMGDGKGC
jgi:hypothetical protein